MVDESVWAPFTAFFIVFCVINVSIGSYKLYMFTVSQGRCKLTLPFLVLGFEILANASKNLLLIRNDIPNLDKLLL